VKTSPTELITRIDFFRSVAPAGCPWLQPDQQWAIRRTRIMRDSAHVFRAIHTAPNQVSRALVGSSQ
jgi:hypothetical protein